MKRIKKKKNKKIRYGKNIWIEDGNFYKIIKGKICRWDPKRMRWVSKPVRNPDEEDIANPYVIFVYRDKKFAKWYRKHGKDAIKNWYKRKYGWIGLIWFYFEPVFNFLFFIGIIILMFLLIFSLF